MSSEWPVVTVDSVCDLIVDCVNKTAPVASEKTPFRMIRTTNVRNGTIDLSDCKYVTEETFEKWTRRAKLNIGDVILTREAPIGEVGLVVEAAGIFLGQRLMQYRANPVLLDSRFLLYAFLSPGLQHQFGSHEGSGSVVSHIRVGDCYKFKIPLPSLQRQKEISSILGALDDRITLLGDTNKTIHSIAQAMFKAWFVDFEPVRAKMEDRRPEGMDEETAALFPDSFEESGLGLIPTHWSARSFHEMIRVIGGGTPKTSNPDYWGGHIPWYSVVDVPSGADTFVLNTEKKITQAGLAGSSTKLLPFGTTIISARGTVGKLALTGCEMAMNQSCYGLRGNNNDIYFTYFSTQRLVEYLKQQAHGSVFDTITTATFKGVRVVSPPPSIIARFETNVEVLMERVLVNLKTLTSLAQLRDTLLPRLISGQIRLPEAQEQVENALS
ncbi:restriction endonuclease subunit S [Achromobacter sp. Root83]|uniref:restriction endonuclease subunit S n=1 Tax=Achromobacter sp. Root83 TaxID=1736602 RepID=UPI0009E8A956|nr:restriction endonuclease subunit S [Achromobacter sp. Root83]